MDRSRTANFNDANDDCSHATLDPDDQYSALPHVVTVDLANSNYADIHVTYEGRSISFEPDLLK